MVPVGGGPRLELPLEVLTFRTFGPLPTLVRLGCAQPFWPHLDICRRGFVAKTIPLAIDYFLVVSKLVTRSKPSVTSTSVKQ